MNFSRIRSLDSLFLLISLWIGVHPGLSAGPDPLLSPDDISSMVASMSLEEKIGQLIWPRSYGHFISDESEEFTRLAGLVREQKIGGLVVFQGDVYETSVLLNKLQKLSRLPLLVAADFERGAAMRIRRSTHFPEAMAIAATRNQEYAYDVGKAIAEEALAIGIHQNLAPVADVNNNPANPVINTRSFGENSGLVSLMVSAFVRGTNDAGAIATAKHFPGHGDTGTDSHIDLPVLRFDRARLDSVELLPFRAAVGSGVGSVMIAHLVATSLDQELPATLSPNVINRLLRREIGFDGLVVTDAMEMRGLLNSYSVGESAVLAIRAGADIILVPADEALTFEALVRAVLEEEIPAGRIDESVTRILTLKQKLGLFEKRAVDVDAIAGVVATESHMLLAKQVARESVTLLKNQNELLPFTDLRRKRVALITLSDSEFGRADIHRPSVSRTNEPFGSYFASGLRDRAGSVTHFRFDPGSHPLEFDDALVKLERYDLLIVAVYAKVRSGSGRMGLPDGFDRFIDRLPGLKKQIVAISFGNPYLISLFPDASALLCSYSDAEPTIEATLEGLFGEVRLSGKLPVSIPGQFGFGDGLTVPQTVLRRDVPAAAGFDRSRLAIVDTIISQGIRSKAFPGAQVAVIRDGALVYRESFGNLTYDPESLPVTGSTMYDLASLTKVVVTTASIMKLYDEGRCSLDDPIVRFLPQFQGASKQKVTIRDLLTHQSGLPAYRDFYRLSTSPTQALDSLYATPLVAEPGDTTIYSDLGMMLLGKVVESITGKLLDEFFAETFSGPLGMTHTMFAPSESRRGSCAPTEEDHFWRMRLVQGTVHDENAELFGGIAGHAGLFSTASDLAVFMQMILNGGTYGGTRFFRESTVIEFTGRETRHRVRALGWDAKSSKGSSAGSLFSISSFGHTGFTGTSIWCDPERRMAVVLLTNRVHPTRENNGIYRIRPLIHDSIVRALVNDDIR